MTGKEFREVCGGLKQINEEGGRLLETIGNRKPFKVIATNLKVLANSTPEDKYMLIVGLQNLSKVTAVTGDCINDGATLKKAAVGLALETTATEVTKEASDIILSDDNFNSILTGVKWGRNLYSNVRKFLQF